MIQIGPLTTEQRQALEQVRRRAVGRVSQRAHMVLLNTRGYSVAQIATIFEVGEDVVRDWLHRYQRQGPPGLDDRPRPGRPPQDRLARQIVDTQARNPPRHSGLVQNLLDGRLAGSFSGRALRPGAFSRECPVRSASDELALGAAAAGSRDTRPRRPAQAGSGKRR